MPVSSLMAGSRMLTADVFALTTSVDRHVTARTPPAREVVPVPLIQLPPQESDSQGGQLNARATGQTGDHPRRMSRTWRRLSFVGAGPVDSIPSRA